MIRTIRRVLCKNRWPHAYLSHSFDNFHDQNYKILRINPCSFSELLSLGTKQDISPDSTMEICNPTPIDIGDISSNTGEYCHTDPSPDITPPKFPSSPVDFIISKLDIIKRIKKDTIIADVNVPSINAKLDEIQLSISNGNIDHITDQLHQLNVLYKDAILSPQVRYQCKLKEWTILQDLELLISKMDNSTLYSIILFFKQNVYSDYIKFITEYIKRMRTPTILNSVSMAELVNILMIASFTMDYNKDITDITEYLMSHRDEMNLASLMKFSKYLSHFGFMNKSKIIDYKITRILKQEITKDDLVEIFQDLPSKESLGKISKFSIKHLYLLPIIDCISIFSESANWNPTKTLYRYHKHILKNLQKLTIYDFIRFTKATLLSISLHETWKGESIKMSFEIFDSSNKYEVFLLTSILSYFNREYAEDKLNILFQSLNFKFDGIPHDILGEILQNLFRFHNSFLYQHRSIFYNLITTNATLYKEYLPILYEIYSSGKESIELDKLENISGLISKFYDTIPYDSVLLLCSVMVRNSKSINNYHLLRSFPLMVGRICDYIINNNIFLSENNLRSVLAIASKYKKIDKLLIYCLHQIERNKTFTYNNFLLSFLHMSLSWKIKNIIHIQKSIYDELERRRANFQTHELVHFMAISTSMSAKDQNYYISLLDNIKLNFSTLNQKSINILAFVCLKNNIRDLELLELILVELNTPALSPAQKVARQRLADRVDEIKKTSTS